MPLAVTHVITGIICVDLYRDYVTKHKHLFPLHTIFAAGFAGLLPDIDIPLGYLLGFLSIDLAHRGLTHTPFFALLFLIPGIMLWILRKHKLAVFFYVMSFGIMLHIFLDYFVSPDNGLGIMFLYPFSMHGYTLGLLSGLSIDFFAGLDAIILLTWLLHEEVKHKIKDYI